MLRRELFCLQISHDSSPDEDVYSLDRLKSLIDGDEPFYIQIAPTAPHTSRDGPPVPCSRHMWSFNNATAPRTPNFNPPDNFQSQKPSWLSELPRLNQSQEDFMDWSYRSRLQSLLGLDELVEDVVEFLREQGRLDNTYGTFKPAPTLPGTVPCRSILLADDFRQQLSILLITDIT